MNKNRQGYSLALSGALAIVCGVGPATGQDATGQDAPGGFTYTFGVSSTLEFNDNYNLDNTSPGNATIFDTRLSFGLLNQTPVDTFSLLLDGVIRVADLPSGSDMGFEDPGLLLGYVREGADSRFTLDAEFSRTDLDFLDPFELADDVEDTDLIISTGEREIRSARLSFETGLNAPIGMLFELGHENIDYTDTTDPDLYDQRTDDYGITTRLRLSPVADGRVVVSQEDYSADDADQTDRRTRELSFGVAYAVSPVTTLDATLGVQEVRETLGAVPSTTTDRGTIGSLGLTRELPNGTAGVLLARTFSVNGSRTSLSFARAMDLPSGTLAASIGATRGEVGSTEIIGSLDYTQTLPRGQIIARLDRSVSTNADGDDVLATRAELGYTMDVGPLSAVSFGVDYVAIDTAGAGTVEETDRTGFRATYTRSLTEDWDLSAGYEHLRRDSSVDGKANSNSVFLTLERDFVFRR